MLGLIVARVKAAKGRSEDGGFAAEEFPETELSVAHERQAGKTHLAKRPEPVT